MNNIITHKSYLKVLETAHPALRKAILQNADKKLLCVLVEIIINFMQGNVPSNANQRKKLMKYKVIFRKLQKQCKNKKHINKATKQTVVQTGGALPFLIPLILPLIAKAALGGAVAATAGIATRKLLHNESI